MGSNDMWVVCRKSTSFKIFVVVIPKEGLTGGAWPIVLLLWHWLPNIICKDNRKQSYSGCLIKRRINRHQPLQSFFWYDTDYTICECCRLQIISHCNTKRRICGAPQANPYFGMTPTKILEDVLCAKFWCDAGKDVNETCFCVMRLMYRQR